MNDQLAIQYALYRGSRSTPLLRDCNIVLGRDYLASKVAQDAVWQMPAPSGKVGVGAIIQIPSVLYPNPNSLQRDREYRIGIYEDPDTNFTVNLGTLRGADDWADVWIDFLWNWQLWRSSGLKPQTRCVVPDARFAEAGIAGVQVIFTARQERVPVARCAPPVITVAGGNATLANADGTDMYFTTDGFSTPAPDNDGSLPSEQAATKYTGAFAVPAGSILMAASWPAAGSSLLPSQTVTKLT